MPLPPRFLAAAALRASLLSAGLGAIPVALAAAPDSASKPEKPGAHADADAPKRPLPDLAKDPEFLNRCKAAAAYSARNEGEGVLIMLDGKVVFEEAQGDWPLSRPHPLASGTKSFSGIAAAFAIQDGLLQLDERASDTLTEWKSDPDKSRITVRQLLSLSAGLDPRQDGLEAFRTGKRSPVLDHAQDALTAPLVAKPGEKFIYGSASFYAFGELMKRKLHAADTGDEDVVEYLDRKLFSKIHIKPYFGKDPSGAPNLPGGCMLDARSWAAFGEFVRNQGKVGDEQLLRPDLLAQLFVPSTTNANYGLTWWLLSEQDENPEDAIRRDEIARRGRLGLTPAKSDKPADADGTTSTDAPRGRLRDRIRDRLRDAHRERAARGASELSREFGVNSIGVMAAGLGKQRLYILPDLQLTVVRFGKLRGQAPYEDRDFLRTLILGDSETPKE